MFDAHKNFAYSTVATAPSPADTGTTLSTQAGEGSRFPATPFNAIVCPAGQQPLPNNAEIVRVTAVSGDSVTTMVRQQEGTSARSIVVGDQIFAGPTIKTLTDIESLVVGPGAWLQQGVVLSTDAALTINSTTSVTVAAASAFFVTNASGLLVPVTINSTTLSGIPAAATYTRLDQIVVDSNGTVTRLAGAESNGVTVANRTGAAAIPAGSCLLHDILVSTSGVAGGSSYRDRRSWARGGYSRKVRVANASAGTDYTTTSTSLVAIDSTNLSVRMECTGNPIRLSLRGRWTNSGANMNLADFLVNGGSSTDGIIASSISGSGAEGSLNLQLDTYYSSGSYLFVPAWKTTGGTATLYARSSISVQFIVEEIIKLPANNGTS